MQRFTCKAAIFIIGLSFVGCGQSSSQLRERWNKPNDPLRLSEDYRRTFKELPLKGKSENLPWSDSYWPSYAGGLADRWREPETNAFDYDPYNLTQLQVMSQAEISKLSPAEKFDIYIANYDYPLLDSERARTSADAEHWEGICHGWAPAAIVFQEPKSIIVENSDGIIIPFAASDIKALLSYYQGERAEVGTKFLGMRCDIDIDENPDARLNPACKDTNAGSFHIVLTNELGLNKNPFVADIQRDLQVWNQPISSFKSRVVTEQQPSEGAAEGTQKEYVIETIIEYVSELSPAWSSFGDEGQSVMKRTYEYQVEVNADDEIIGGEWISETRPDFLWTQEPAEFHGEFESLKVIYEKSISSNDDVPDPLL
jgi:hypothetical protein